MVQKEWSIPGNLQQVMASMTHREYLMRVAWLEESWKEPGPTEYYLMQVAQEVRRVLCKKPEKILLKHFRIKFSSRKDAKREAKQNALKSRANWFGILGLNNNKDD